MIARLIYITRVVFYLQNKHGADPVIFLGGHCCTNRHVSAVGFDSIRRRIKALKFERKNRGWFDVEILIILIGHWKSVEKALRNRGGNLDANSTLNWLCRLGYEFKVPYWHSSREKILNYEVLIWLNCVTFNCHLLLPNLMSRFWYVSKSESVYRFH